MFAKVTGILFLLFLLLVVAAASAGRLPPFVRALYDFPQGDRVGHVILYGLVAFFLTWAFPRRLSVRRFRIPMVGAGILIFAIIEECSQSLFSSRTADLIDLACSVVGLTLGTWAASRWRNEAAELRPNVQRIERTPREQ